MHAGVIEGILGNVTERAGSGVDDTTVGSMHSNVTHWHMHADIPMEGGFPAATHRKMSKVGWEHACMRHAPVCMEAYRRGNNISGHLC